MAQQHNLTKLSDDELDKLEYILSNNVDAQYFLDHHSALALPDSMCITATGQLYDTAAVGFIPTLIEHMYSQRREFKKQALAYKQGKENTKDPVRIKELERLITRADTQQMAIKILRHT